MIGFAYFATIDDRKGMEMHQLRYFAAVARTGNFTRAAAQCHVAQPSLSQQIRKLEDELGEKLIARLPGGKSRLTPAGETLLKRANRILAEAQDAVDELRARHDTIVGTVRVGAIPTIAPYLVPEALLAFNEVHPQVEFVVQEATTEQLLALIERNELDFALASPPLPGGPWRIDSLGHEPLMLAAREGSRWLKSKRPRLDDLREEEFILMREGHCLTGQVVRFCEASDFRPQVRFLSAQVETLKALIRAGAGVSLLPAMAVGAQPAPGDPLRITRLRAPAPSREIAFVSLPEATPSRAARAFQATTREIFRRKLNAKS